MSKPRYRWWSYVKACIRSYPQMAGKNGVERREREAVKKAIAATEAMPTGADRLRVIDLVMWRQTHTLEGAAQEIPCSYETAKRYHGQFIRLVAANMGLLKDDLPEPK